MPINGGSPGGVAIDRAYTILAGAYDVEAVTSRRMHRACSLCCHHHSGTNTKALKYDSTVAYSSGCSR